MNDLKVNNQSMPIGRTPELIASEINFYKAQTATGIIEIGKRLIEAQDLLGEGENFTMWLGEKVDFSRRTAYNFMKVAKEFNDVQSLARLGQTKVFKLLEIPAEEREEFMNSTHEINGEEKNIDEMSTRELQKVLKERDDAIEKLNNAKNTAIEACEKAKTLQEEVFKAEADKNLSERVLRETQADVKMLQESLKKEREKSKSEQDKLTTSMLELKKQLTEAKTNGNSEEEQALQFAIKDLEDELSDANTKVKELEEKLKEIPIEVAAIQEVIVEKVPEEIEKELEELRKQNEDLQKKFNVSPDNPSILKYTYCFSEVVGSFQKLLSALAEIKEDELHDKYSNAIKGLIAKMDEKL